MSRIHAEVVEGRAAAHTAVLVHGILGSGRNWRSFARRLADRRPGWRFVLPDLRNHGDSPPLAGPHTVAACAGDLHALAAEVGTPEVIIGHSFGGKVALAYARDHGDALRHVAVLDAPPGPPAAAGGEEARQVLSAVRAAPVPCPRDEIRRSLQERGLPEGIIAWLLTSTRATDGRWVWKYDIDGVEAMLADYFRLDLLPFVEALPAPLDALFVRAGRSDRWDQETVDRLEAAPRVRVATMPDAGHWLQVDDPDGLMALLDPLLET